jgi:hypothetical protein
MTMDAANELRQPRAAISAEKEDFLDPQVILDSGKLP